MGFDSVCTIGERLETGLVLRLLHIGFVPRNGEWSNTALHPCAR